MFSKRGLSNIVATVLIVLLVLAAVVLVWNVIKPAIESTGESIDIRSECLLIDLKPTKCVNNSQTSADVKVQLLQGSPNKITAILEFTDGSSATNTGSPPSQLATTVINVPFSPSTKVITTASVAAIITDSEGNDQICDEITTKVDCV